MDRPKQDDKSPWLHAFFDPLAGLRTVTSCVRLADLNGDGDSKLCVCDFDQKLKVFKGTSLFAEYALLDSPVAMCAVFTELASVRCFRHPVRLAPAIYDPPRPIPSLDCRQWLLPQGRTCSYTVSSGRTGNGVARPWTRRRRRLRYGMTSGRG